MQRAPAQRVRERDGSECSVRWGAAKSFDVMCHLFHHEHESSHARAKRKLSKCFPRASDGSGGAVLKDIADRILPSTNTCRRWSWGVGAAAVRPVGR